MVGEQCNHQLGPEIRVGQYSLSRVAHPIISSERTSNIEPGYHNNLGELLKLSIGFATAGTIAYFGMQELTDNLTLNITTAAYLSGIGGLVAKAIGNN